MDSPFDPKIQQTKSTIYFPCGFISCRINMLFFVTRCCDVRSVALSSLSPSTTKDIAIAVIDIGWLLHSCSRICDVLSCWSMRFAVWNHRFPCERKEKYMNSDSTEMLWAASEIKYTNIAVAFDVRTHTYAPSSASNIYGCLFKKSSMQIRTSDVRARANLSNNTMCFSFSYIFSCQHRRRCRRWHWIKKISSVALIGGKRWRERRRSSKKRHKRFHW